MSNILGSLSSEKVTGVFPFSNERSFDPYARVLSEETISAFIKRLTQKSGYVLSFDSKTTVIETNVIKTNVVEFVIQGYYFKADVSDFLNTGITNLYAGIKIVTDTTDSGSYRYLAGDEAGDKASDGTDDATSKFTGLSFYSDPSTADAEKEQFNITDFLWILTKGDDGEWSIPVKSKLMYETDRVHVINENRETTNLQQYIDAVDTSLTWKTIKKS